VAVRRIWGEPFGHLGVVPVHDVELAVGAESNAVRAVLAVTVEFLEELDVELAIVAFAAPIEAETLRASAIHVETLVGIKQPHRLRDRQAELLNAIDLSVLDG